jgi:hypothetical protein
VTAHAKTFDEALRDCASRIAPGTERATEIMRLSGGASLETWSFRARGPDIDRPLIMRRHSANVDAPVRLGLEIEARLMRVAGAAGVPSPPVLYVLEPDDDLGSGFIMDRVPGETIPRKPARRGPCCCPAAARSPGWRDSSAHPRHPDRHSSRPSTVVGAPGTGGTAGDLSARWTAAPGLRVRAPLAAGSRAGRSGQAA